MFTFREDSIREQRVAVFELPAEPEGYLGVDFDLRNLPGTGVYVEPAKCQQIKGDTSIRGTVFQQTRMESQLNKNIDQAESIIEKLVVAYGVFR